MEINKGIDIIDLLIEKKIENESESDIEQLEKKYRGLFEKKIIKKRDIHWDREKERENEKEEDRQSERKQHK